MRKRIIFCLLLFPLFVNAQLDRVRTNMTEQEFKKAFPEATRNYQAEAYWMNAWDTLEGSVGNSMWLISADTVSAYSFRSVKAEGPSHVFKTVDSTKVHALRVSAEKVETALEKKFGKPAVFRSTGLLSVPPKPLTQPKDGFVAVEQYELLFAQWNFPGDKTITVQLSNELSSGNRINAPVDQYQPTSESYELKVTCDEYLHEPLWHFEVGQGIVSFIPRHPGVQGGQRPGQRHIYRIADTEISKGAAWSFTFQNDALAGFEYRSSGGIAYGDESNEIVYNSNKYRAEKLLAEGKIAFGKPDSVINNIVPEYTLPSQQLAYRKTYLAAVWNTPAGSVNMTFEEMGGGKNGSVRFSLVVDFLAR